MALRYLDYFRRAGQTYFFSPAKIRLTSTSEYEYHVRPKETFQVAFGSRPKAMSGVQLPSGPTQDWKKPDLVVTESSGLQSNVLAASLVLESTQQDHEFSNSGALQAADSDLSNTTKKESTESPKCEQRPVLTKGELVNDTHLNRGRSRSNCRGLEQLPQDRVSERDRQLASIHVPKEKDPSDGVYFAQYKGHPETLVVYRSPEERTVNPERLNLDRRHLTVCPVLKSEERIRLLNYQNNYIAEIQNLSHLPNLIFLDLYNNCIEHLSSSLDCVPTLRVLMLGKNRIKAMTHLDKLVKLDVLDLHSNAIAKVERLNALSELRVLNLAGNRLTDLDNLSYLQSLTELNVRRNQIVKVNSLQQLQSLQRVFLSNNRIQSFDEVACLFGVRFLMELSMDGNPIVMKDPLSYRRFIIGHVKSLRHLDLKRITDAERRDVALESQKEDERRRAAEKNEMIEFERRKLQTERYEAICAAEHQWISQTAGEFSLGSEVKVESHQSQGGSSPLTPEHYTRLQNIPANDASLKSLSMFPSREQTSAFPKDAHVRLKSHQKETRKAPCQLTPSVGYYEVAFAGAHREERALQLYGEAWDCLESQKIVASSTALACRFVSIDRIVEKLSYHARSFIKLKSATFGDNAIHKLRHIMQLTNILQCMPSLIELNIEANPICALNLLKPILCAILPSIKKFNGLNVQISKDNQFLHSMRIRSFCGHLERVERLKIRNQVDQHVDANHQESFKRIITTATNQALRSDELRHSIERFWPLVTLHVIDECLDHASACNAFFANELIWN
mmetsp:Transcript_32171/g.99357  ORF Transcript_32171/g.99357 Transcript_32171/m.99357 type:complete len:790 (+) Transcript_32171:284-2653(+)